MAGTWTLALLAASFWLLLHPYQGLSGDAALNALAVLAEAGAPGLEGDIYLHAGGHGPWSAIGPAYAPAAHILGIELSARLASVVGSLLWLGAFFALARQCLPSDRAMLALALTVTLGATLAPFVLADYLGNSLTARLPASALVLMGLALYLGNRWYLAAIALLTATWLHPQIGMSGLLVCAVTGTNRRHVLATMVVLLVLLIAVALLKHGTWALTDSLTEAKWLHWMQSRDPRLFLTEWNIKTWWSLAAASIPVWILAAGHPMPGAARLLRSAVFFGLSGVIASGLISWLAPDSELFPLGTSTWIWLPLALLGIAAAGGATALVDRGPRAGNPVWLATAGWLLPGAVGASLLGAALLLWSTRDRLPQRLSELFRLPCMAVFGTCALVWLHGVLSSQGLHGVFTSGIAATIIVILAFWAAGRPLLAAPCIAAGLCSFAATVPNAEDWLLKPEFSVVHAPTLASWQSTIPADADVLWPQRPEASWFILRRKNYLSKLQSNAVSQSPKTAIELSRRSQELVGILPPAILFTASPIDMLFKMSRHNLFIACQHSRTAFVISERALEFPSPAKPMELNWNHSKQRISVYLYDCEDVLNSSSIAPDAR